MELTSNINEKELALKKVNFNPFDGPKIIKTTPTTPSQLEIWLSCIIGGEDANRSYNLSISLALHGPLDLEAWYKSLEIIQERHESLRSTFSVDGKSMCIHDTFPLEYSYKDFSEDTVEIQNSTIRQLHESDAQLSFNLSKGPLFRSYLIKRSDDVHLFKLCAHHIICDGWSLGTILENLSAIYNSIINETELTLEKPIPYSFYAQQIKNYSQTTEYHNAEKYWLNLYKDKIPVIDLPTDNERPSDRTFSACRRDFEVPKTLIDSLKNLGAKRKSSLITTLIAGFEIYLHLLTKQDDISLGLPAAGQSATGNLELIGHCVNLLPLRSHINNRDSFQDYLGKRKSEILDAYDNQQFTFSSLLQKLNIARDSSRIPLVPVIFNVDMGMGDNISFAGLNHELFSDPRAYENFEIFLNITGTDQKLTFEWSYNSYLFQSTTIERMMSEFQSVLEQIIEEPSIKIKDIHISNDTTLFKEINNWNNTKVPYPRNKTVADLINETAVKYPTKTAIYFNDRELTYTELNHQSNQLAHLLLSKNIGNGDIVGLIMDRTPEMIIALLGIIKSGATYLPIDPEYPEGRIQYMLTDSNAKHVITSRNYEANLSITSNKFVYEDIFINAEHLSKTYPVINKTNERQAYILYTSGSTGKPKGVQIMHSSLTNFLLSVQKEPGIHADDTLLAVSTISFDIAATEIFLPITVGASIYLADNDTVKDGKALLEIIQNRRISIMQATPLTWRMVLAAGWKDQLPLKIICTGEAFPKDLAETLITKGNEVWNGYGPTEATIWSSVKQITDTDEIISIGKPIANTQMYVLDQDLIPVPLGSTGELYIAGDGLAKGYLSRPELTDEKFILSPFGKGTRIYKTGDLGYHLPNGEIVCLGRIDSQVKIRGHRIELGEIEYQLRQEEGVGEVVVLAYGSDKDNQQLIAYIVTKQENSLDKISRTPISLSEIPQDQSRAWKNSLKTNLPEFMIPTIFLGLNRFPTTDNGKIDRENLPIPDKSQINQTRSNLCQPTTNTEKLIHDIWCQHLDRTTVDIHDNFFELGGHSLIAVRVMLDLEEKADIKFPISVLFQNSTIAKLASYINSKSNQIDNTVTSAIDNSSSQETIRTVPAIDPQKEIWVACMLGEDSANKSYNLSFSLRFTGLLNRPAIEMALQELVNRHESLRATFSDDGTEMLIKSFQNVDYTYYDITSLLPDEQNSFIEKLQTNNSDCAFNLTTGPLFKTHLIQQHEEEHLLTITFHHIICDGFSCGILINELNSLYNSYTKHEPTTLPAPNSFSRYSVSKNDYYKSSEYQETQKFWIDQFSSEVPILNIPTDFTRPKKRTYNGSREFHIIRKDLAEGIKKIGHSLGCSNSISLRAILEIFLYRISGQQTLVTGLPSAGQLIESNPHLIGHCVNLLPLKANVNSDQSFLEYLKERRDYMLSAYDHNNLTFSSLVNKLNISRDTARIPLTPVVLNIQTESYNVDFNGLTAEKVEQKKIFETFEIAVNIEEAESGLLVRWDYNKDLFKKETIRYFHLFFEDILRQVIEQPSLQIKNIDLYPQLSQKKPNVIQPISLSLYELLHISFDKFSKETAVNFKGETLSYAALNEQSNQLARFLLSNGIQEGDKVAIAIERSVELIVTILAIVKAGASYLPIDITFPKDRVDKIINNAQPVCILKSSGVSEIESSSIPIFEIKHCLNHSTKLSKDNINPCYDENNLVFILHTSGSTGQPKGVCMGQKAMVNLLLWQKKNSFAKLGTRTLQFSPVTFDVSFQEIFSTFTTGGTLELITNDERLDGLALLEHIIVNKVERIFLPFVALQSLVESAVETNRLPKDLKEVITAGEQLKITRPLADFFSKLPEAKLFNHYGPTETHIVTQLVLAGNPKEWPNLPSIGKPIDNTNIYILDSQLREVFPGAPGELCVAGSCLASGYLNMESATNEKFINWKSSNGERIRLYRTGDLASILPNGNIDFLGRMDHQVKIRGYRIELGEIETELSKLPDCSQVAVKVQEDKTGNKRLIAYYTLNNNIENNNRVRIDIGNWRSALKLSLPEYMIPHEFIELQVMPKTLSGKIDRIALPKISEFGNCDIKKEIKKPTNENETLLLKIWENVLGIKKISIDDDFFELGGHSILAVKIIIAIEKERNRRLPLAILFEKPTIQQLATILDDKEDNISWNSLVTIKSSGSKTPIYLVHGGGLNVLTFKPLAKYLDIDQPLYALQARGLNGNKTDLLYTMEDLADQYISEILDHNPLGPYILGGYSFGGLLAYEMSKRLIQMGKEIKFLVILDTYCGGRDQYENSKSRNLRKITRQFFKFGFIVKSLFNFPSETIKYQRNFIHNKIRKLRSGDYIANKDFFTYNVEINRSYDIAYNNYKMSPLNVKVHLFKTEKRLYFLDDGKYYGWKKYALKGVEAHIVPGDHKTLLHSPNDKTLAKKLQKVANNGV